MRKNAVPLREIARARVVTGPGMKLLAREGICARLYRIQFAQAGGASAPLAPPAPPGFCG